MTLFTARGQQMKLVIDGKFIGKKVKIWKFWAKPILCTSKESLEHVEFRFRCKKFDFLWKKSIFSIFYLFSKGGTLGCRDVKIFFLNFSKFSIFFLKNGFNGTYKMMNETKSWNMSSFGASTKESWGIIYMCGHKVPPPCSIGLNTASLLSKI